MKLIATRQARTDKYDELRCLRNQAVHAEAVVESLQAQLWSAGADPHAFDDAMFLEGVRSACDVRWQALPRYGALELELAEP